MSLVAYGSSGESDAEQNHDNLAPKEIRAGRDSNSASEILERDEFVAAAAAASDDNSSRGISIATLHNSFHQKDGDMQKASFNFEALPTPKLLNSDEHFQEENELEDVVKPKPSQLCDLEKPVKKQRLPVKIDIPSLEADLDEDVVARKKPKLMPSKTSDLISLLPAPKHFKAKETNRILLPYSLTKRETPSRNQTMGEKNHAERQTSAKKTAKGQPLSRKLQGVYSYSSDEEEEEILVTKDFFSLDSSHISKTGFNSTPDLDSRELANPYQDFTFYSTSSLGADKAVTVPGVGEANASSSSDSLHQSVTNPQHHFIYEQENAASGNQILLQQPVAACYDDMQQYLQDEQFLRLQGKKQRGKEDINFIDVNTNDFVDTTEMTKSLTKEMPRHSHSKKDNLPSTQQRRKHQITYLAYQAKERELELKNQWAQNRLTKRQTQAKYGF